MENFKVSLNDLETIAVGEVLEFPVGPKGRTLEVEIIAAEPVGLMLDYAGHMENAKLIASGSHFKVSVFLEHVAYLALAGKGHVECSIITKTRPQRFEADTERASVTTIEPKGSRTSEFDRMAYMMQRNQRRMMEQLQALSTELTETKRKAQDNANGHKARSATLDAAPAKPIEKASGSGDGDATKAAGDTDPAGS